MKSALITYLCNDLFAPGALALLESIKENSPDILDEVEILCFCLEDVTRKMQDILIKSGFQVLKISKKDYLYSSRKDFTDRYKNISWMMFTKLKIFSFFSYRKIIYLDADVVVNKSIKELLLKKSFLAAILDENPLNKKNIGLNGGVLVLEPNEFQWERIKSNLNNFFPGGHTDQSLLNGMFPDFLRLDKKYNVLDKARRRKHLFPFDKMFLDSHIYHFNGQKPWILFYKNNGWKNITDISYLKFWKYLFKSLNIKLFIKYHLTTFLINLFFSNIIFLLIILKRYLKKIINFF